MCVCVCVNVWVGKGMGVRVGACACVGVGGCRCCAMPHTAATALRRQAVLAFIEQLIMVYVVLAACVLLLHRGGAVPLACLCADPSYRAIPCIPVHVGCSHSWSLLVPLDHVCLPGG